MFYRFVFILFFFVSARSWGQLLTGDVVVIDNQKYIVNEKLGEGAIKNVYRAIKLDPPGKGAAVAIGTHQLSDLKKGDYDFEINQRLVNSPSVHLRKEYQLVKAKVEGVEGETWVSLMEYAEQSLNDVDMNRLSIESIRLLMEDAYQATNDLEELGLTYFDAKPANMALAGEMVSDATIKSGKSYLALSDFGPVYPANKIIPSEGKILWFSRTFAAPEFYQDSKALSNGAVLWQISLSFYKKLFEKDAFTWTELNSIFVMFHQDKEAAKQAKNVYQKKLKLIKKDLNEFVKKAKTSEEKKMAKEIRELILNGLNPEPYNRQRWPQKIPRRRLHPQTAPKVKKWRLPKIKTADVTFKAQEIDFISLKKFIEAQRRRCSDANIKKALFETGEELEWTAM